jgi:uncharacterized membrane protein YagU involved in acid resistance
MATFGSARSRSPLLQVFVGGITLATLDLVYACSIWAWLRDVPPVRVLQFIASGALGDAAFVGGYATALLGVGLHYFIATIMALTYYLVSRRHRALVRYPVRYGLPYGLLLWGVMTYVVVPLSQAHPAAKPMLLPFVTNLLMHLLFGVICAWFARRAQGLR